MFVGKMHLSHISLMNECSNFQTFGRPTTSYFTDQLLVMALTTSV